MCCGASGELLSRLVGLLVAASKDCEERQQHEGDTADGLEDSNHTPPEAPPLGPTPTSFRFKALGSQLRCVKEGCALHRLAVPHRPAPDIVIVRKASSAERDLR